MTTAPPDRRLRRARAATGALFFTNGALFANLIAQPIAVRLRRAARIEAFERARIEVPLTALARREAPLAAVTPPTPPRRPLATVA